MGPVDLIEKLINEHGNAEIMEKRLVLFKEQAAAIDQRNGRLESENAELKRALELSRESVTSCKPMSRKLRNLTSSMRQRKIC
jgi:hypothetical protein